MFHGNRDFNIVVKRPRAFVFFLFIDIDFVILLLPAVFRAISFTLCFFFAAVIMQSFPLQDQ